MSENGTKLLLVFRIVFTILLIGTIIFIFGNSSEIGEESGLRSAAVTEWLNRVGERVGIGFRFSEYQVRKLAHFSEYAMLGFWLMLTLRVYTKRILSHIAWPLFLGLLIPVLDESYQMLVPDRAGRLQDVLIDFAGVMAGLCVALFILLLSRAFWEGLQGRDY